MEKTKTPREVCEEAVNDANRDLNLALDYLRNARSNLKDAVHWAETSGQHQMAGQHESNVDDLTDVIENVERLENYV